ncbi:MAG: biopolymer transporter ExbD [Muribaculaceae bacterium]|nr:biopolymer transporter ExbD [Muribaculaceae bacterium]
MGKVKVKKHSTIIDMTAMSDVTVLLLTFFMLTSTFLQKEPVQVVAPPSVSDEKVYDEKVVQVLVGPTGKVYMNFTGTKETDSTKTKTLPTEKFREEVVTTAYSLYRSAHSGAPALTETDVKEFGRLGMFGVPMKDLVSWIGMSVEERDKLTKEGEGIPIDENSKDFPNGKNKVNEFQKYWLPAVINVLQKHELGEDIRGGHLVAVKAGKDTPFEYVHIVMENLQTAHLNKFVLMTSFKSEKDR